MRISQEQAMGLAGARNRLQIVRAGQAFLICPYLPGGRYGVFHWVPDAEKSMPCGGDSCVWHQYQAIPKLHLPAMIHSRIGKPEEYTKLDYPDGLAFLAERWQMKVIELTAGTFKYVSKPSEPDQLAIVSRAPGRNNGPLTFQWIRGTLRNVPKSIAHVSVEDLLPLVIHGTYVNAMETSIDKDENGRTKHNSN